MLTRKNYRNLRYEHFHFPSSAYDSPLYTVGTEQMLVAVRLVEPRAWHPSPRRLLVQYVRKRERERLENPGGSEDSLTIVSAEFPTITSI